MTEQVAEHFEDIAKQAHAARLGMWVFLGSEVLFFSGFFGLYATYRTEHPYGFGLAVEHNTVAWGSINTGVLLVSSYTIALALHELRRARPRRSALLIGATMVLGACFLAIKAGEYGKHFSEGIYPGGVGRFYQEHGDPGIKMFFTLYFAMTGLHALHMVVGLGIFTWLLTMAWKGLFTPEYHTPLEIGGLYWHFVDIIWIYLFPLLYLIDRHK